MATNLEIFEIEFVHSDSKQNYELKKQLAIYKDTYQSLMIRKDLLLERKNNILSTISRIEAGELDLILEPEKLSYLSQLNDKKALIEAELLTLDSDINEISDNILKSEIQIMILEY